MKVTGDILGHLTQGQMILCHGLLFRHDALGPTSVVISPQKPMDKWSWNFTCSCYPAAVCNVLLNFDIPTTKWTVHSNSPWKSVTHFEVNCPWTSIWFSVAHRHSSLLIFVLVFYWPYCNNAHNVLLCGCLLQQGGSSCSRHQNWLSGSCLWVKPRTIKKSPGVLNLIF